MGMMGISFLFWRRTVPHSTGRWWQIRTQLAAENGSVHTVPKLLTDSGKVANHRWALKGTMLFVVGGEGEVNAVVVKQVTRSDKRKSSSLRPRHSSLLDGRHSPGQRKDAAVDHVQCACTDHLSVTVIEAMATFSLLWSTVRHLHRLYIDQHPGTTRAHHRGEYRRDLAKAHGPT